jgi:hypothetical protein
MQILGWFIMLAIVYSGYIWPTSKNCSNICGWRSLYEQSINLASPTNIKLGRKFRLESNTLAYYAGAYVRQGILKGIITKLLTSCLTGLESVVWQLKIFYLFAKQTYPSQSNRRSMVQWYFPLVFPVPGHENAHTAYNSYFQNVLRS